MADYTIYNEIRPKGLVINWFKFNLFSIPVRIILRRDAIDVSAFNQKPEKILITVERYVPELQCHTFQPDMVFSRPIRPRGRSLDDHGKGLIKFTYCEGEGEREKKLN